eukprot:431412-Rhodomonas_salina.1
MAVGCYFLAWSRIATAQATTAVKQATRLPVFSVPRYAPTRLRVPPRGSRKLFTGNNNHANCRSTLATTQLYTDANGTLATSSSTTGKRGIQKVHHPMKTGAPWEEGFE